MADIKFTVVYDKSIARLELPPTATLAALAELLADRFSEAQPKAIELKLPDADASLRLLDFPEATLDSAGIADGCEVCMSVGKSAAPAAAAADVEFAKGQLVLYRTRDGAWVEAKVVHVDYSVLPFSYGIEIDGNYRETEATRLAPLPQEQKAAM